MNGSSPPDPLGLELTAEIDDQWSNIQQVIEGLREVSKPEPDEPLDQRANDYDRASLRSLATPTVTPQPLMQVIQEAYYIFNYRMRTNHPHFFSFIPSNSTDLSWLGDMIVSAFNAHLGGTVASAGPCAVETALVEWLAAKVGFGPTKINPTKAGGLFVSGGSVANLIAFIVARDQKLRVHDRTRGVIYVGDQAHYSLRKAARIVGFGADQIHCVQSNSQFQMDPEDLQRQVEIDRQYGRVPFLIVASFGCTETGAVDPIETLARIAREQGAWLHVDGAYGASAALASENSAEAKKMGVADSVSWDAHKWLMQTYGCGMILVRDKSTLTSSFYVKGDNVVDRAGRVRDTAEFWDLGIELTRPARAISFWFTLRVLGEERIGRMIDQGIELTQAFQSLIEQRRNWEIVAPASLAIINFRYNPGHRSEEQLATLNELISKELLAGNMAALMTTRLRGKLALRICCINTRLTGEDMVVLMERMDRIATEMDQMQRASWKSIEQVGESDYR
ncbi:hypothetical protein FE257_000824 [Aspergillus nanangensis]|uniref:Uncharacterized protein n=1 Tax=Aspergillus nanangensis TaxID=2582783 RepID=A0AAD4CEG7_ASPNN|nr:hypothetical protein FE257_000824 [Aspergillus nanangensis]